MGSIFCDVEPGYGCAKGIPLAAVPAPINDRSQSLTHGLVTTLSQRKDKDMATFRKRGSTWQVQVRRQGHLPINRTFRSKPNAEVWARMVEGQIDRSELPQATLQLKAVTLGDLITRYRNEITPQKKSCPKETYRLNRMLQHRMAQLTLDKATPAVFAAFRDERLRQVGSQAVRHDLNVLSHIFTIAIQEWDVPLSRNPVSPISKPSISKARDRRVIDGELDRMIPILKARHGDVAVDLVCFAIETGMRQAEILSATWRHVDLANRTLHIPEAKNGHPRTIPLTSNAIELLRRRKGTHDERVFPVTKPWLRFVWEKATKAAGTNNLHFHDLRHEAISRFFEKGLSVAEVALISGHRDVRQLFRYTHLRAEDVAKKLGSYEWPRAQSHPWDRASRLVH